jgi:imidazolonepropionase-like amidohydrolase
MTVSFVSALTLLAAIQAAPAGDPKVYALTAARLIDGRASSMVENAVVVVSGGIITGVGRSGSVEIPPGTERIELGDQTILPGLIDGHTHVAGRSDSRLREGQRELWQQDTGVQMTRAVRHARLNLLSGVTTGRVAGDPARTDFFLRDAIEAGRVPGPRILPSGQWVSTTTGGTIRSRRVDGPWEIIELIRNNIEDGASQIKVILYGKTATTTNFTREELKAAVDETHRHGKIVTAHASDPPSIRQVIEAGVDNIEHGANLDDELIRMLVENKIAVDSTSLAGYQAYFDEGWPYQDRHSTSIEDWTSWVRGLIQKVHAEHPERLEIRKKRQGEILKAHRAGVPIFVGLDNFHGLLALEIEFLVEAGFTPMEAIQSATSVAAKAIGLGEKTGALERGRWADVISVRGNPLEDVGALSRVSFVMVGGKRYDGLSYR